MDDPTGPPRIRRRRILVGGIAGAGIVLTGGALVRTRSADPGPDAPPAPEQPMPTPPGREALGEPSGGPARDAAQPDGGRHGGRTAERPPARRLEILCRDSWGAAPPTAGMRRHVVGAVMLHHTGTRLGDNRHAPERLRLHQRHHQRTAGWGDIAYHLAVDLSGNVYELRDPAYAGDTFTGYEPAGHLLVVAEGDYGAQTPSDRLLGGLAAAIAWGCGTFGILPATLTSHRDHVPSTACPGDRLQARLRELRREAEALIAAGGVEGERLCGDAGRARVRDIAAGRA